jgi:PPOX class probable F420-dependent enzyme
MGDLIPKSHVDLLEDKKRAFAVLATTFSDGSPQATPVWFDVADGRLRVNTARGRTKDRNMTRRPTVALCILDPQNPYRYLQVRGRVVETDEAGGRAHIDRLASKYQGKARYEGPATERRVIYVIEPISAQAMG